MSTHFVAMPILALAVLVLLGGLAALIAMLAHPKTRVAGGVLLTVGLLVLFVAGGGLFWSRSVGRHEAVRERQMHRMMQDRMRARAEQQRIEAEIRRGEDLERTFRGLLTPTPPDASEDLPGDPAETPATAAGSEAEVDPKPDSATGPDAEPSSEASEPEPTPEPEETPEATGATGGEEPSDSSGRPTWVDTPAGKVSGVYQTVVTVGPYTSLAECESQMPGALNRAVSRYLEEEFGLGPGAARRLRLPPEIIRDYIVSDRWDETTQFRVGPMIQSHVLLRFDLKANALIEQQWQRVVVNGRLWYAGIGVVTLLGLLSVLFVCLKIDQATEGSYRGRLGLAAAGATLAVLAAAWLVIMGVRGHTLATEAGPFSLASLDSPDLALSDPFGPPQETGLRSPGSTGVAGLDETPKLVLLVVLGLAGLAAVAGLVALLLKRTTRWLGLVLLGVATVAVLAVVSPRMGFALSVGPLELVVLGGVLILVLIVTMVTANRWPWIAGLVGCFALAAIFTPADPASMLLVAVPLSVVYGLAVAVRRIPRMRSGGGKPPSKLENA